MDSETDPSPLRSPFSHSPVYGSLSAPFPALSRPAPAPSPLSLCTPLFSLLWKISRTTIHKTQEQTDTIDDVSARLRRSERKRKAQAAELAEARAEASEAKSELSRALGRAAAAAAAQAQQEMAKNETDPEQQRRLRERDAEISRLRDRLEAATGELSEEQVRHSRFFFRFSPRMYGEGAYRVMEYVPAGGSRAKPYPACQSYGPSKFFRDATRNQLCSKLARTRLDKSVT